MRTAARVICAREIGRWKVAGINQRAAGTQPHIDIVRPALFPRIFAVLRANP
jgi:hypothetical protein